MAFDSLEQLRQAHWDGDEKMWYSDKALKVAATDEQVLEFRSMVRQFKFANQIEKDHHMSLDNSTPFAQRRTLKALIARRLHPEFWPLIGKKLPDGSLFTFDLNPQVISRKVCNCSDEALMAEASSISDTESNINFADVRVLHELALNKPEESKDEYDATVTCNWIMASINVRQSTHTIGNVDCQACAVIGNTGEEITEKTISPAKINPVCPRWLEFARGFPMKEYLKMLKVENPCYAGLLHVEMDVIDNPNILETAQIKTQELLRLTYKCDTCAYESVRYMPYEIAPKITNEVFLLDPNTQE